MLPSIHVALQTLRKNPVRTILSTLGVVMGAAALVGVLSLGDGLEMLSRAEIGRAGLQTVHVVAKTADVVDGLTFERSTYPIFSDEQVGALGSSVMAGSAVAITVEASGKLMLRQGAPERAVQVTGVRGSPEAANFEVAHGRFLSSEEMNGAGAIAVISNRLAEEITPGVDPATLVGRTLTLQGRSWSIVGVLPAVLGERTLGVVVPLEALPDATLPVPKARPRRVMVRSPRVEDVPALRTQIEAWADRMDPLWRRDSQVTISALGQQRQQQLESALLMFRLLIGSLGMISLMVGGIGIMNVLLAAVIERTREIGLRKSVGAKRRDIVAQFLVESVVISGTGSLLGAAVGFGGASLAAWFMRSQTRSPVYAVMTIETLVISVGTALTIGLIFGMYPALKAARLSPVEAMRYE
jgi:putative ABC transport system permease protein